MVSSLSEILFCGMQLGLYTRVLYLAYKKDIGISWYMYMSYWYMSFQAIKLLYYKMEMFSDPK